MKKLLIIAILFFISNVANAMQPMEYMNKRSQILNGIAGLAWNRCSSLDARYDILQPKVTQQKNALYNKIVEENEDDAALYENFIANMVSELEIHFVSDFSITLIRTEGGNQALTFAANAAAINDWTNAMMWLTVAQNLFNDAYYWYGDNADIHISLAQQYYELAMGIYEAYYEPED